MTSQTFPLFCRCLSTMNKVRQILWESFLCFGGQRACLFIVVNTLYAERKAYIRIVSARYLIFLKMGLTFPLINRILTYAEE